MKKSKNPQPAKKVRRSEQAGGKAQSLPLILDQSAGDPILVFDLDGRVTHANNTAQTCFKIPEQDFVGRHFHDFVHPHSLSRFQSAFDKATQSMSQGGVELEGVTSKKERIPFEVTFAPVMQGGKVCAVHTIGRDLRPRRRLEQLTVEAEKMKAVQLFVRGTALELRNPLLGVLRQSESLVNEYAKRDFEYIGFREFSEIMSNLESISEQIKYCYSTVERLVKLNQRRVRLKKSFCHPHDVIEELVILKEEQLRANNIRLSVQLATRLPSIAIGEIDFNQIMTNLFNNAIEAMPGGGGLDGQDVVFEKDPAGEDCDSRRGDWDCQGKYSPCL